MRKRSELFSILTSSSGYCTPLIEEVYYAKGDTKKDEAEMALKSRLEENAKYVFYDLVVSVNCKSEAFIRFCVILSFFGKNVDDEKFDFLKKEMECILDDAIEYDCHYDNEKLEHFLIESDDIDLTEEEKIIARKDFANLIYPNGKNFFENKALEEMAALKERLNSVSPLKKEFNEKKIKTALTIKAEKTFNFMVDAFGSKGNAYSMFVLFLKVKKYEICKMHSFINSIMDEIKKDLDNDGAICVKLFKDDYFNGKQGELLENIIYSILYNEAPKNSIEELRRISFLADVDKFLSETIRS